MTYMSNIFFDTNILYYAYDSSEPIKQGKAQQHIADAIAQGNGYTSVQALGEFFHTTVIRKRLFKAEKAESIIKCLGGLHILDIDYPMIRKAIDNHRQFQTSYWDSLILAAAQRASCKILYTEDLNHGQNYDGPTANNPFLSTTLM